MSARLADVIAALEAAYPPGLAAGLGRRRARLRRPGGAGVDAVLVARRSRSPRPSTRRSTAASQLLRHPPPAAAARRARRRRRHPEGRAGAPARPRRARRCSPRTPTPTRPTPACPTRSPTRSGSTVDRARWSPPPTRRSTRSSPSSRSVPAIAAVHDALAAAGAGNDRRLQPLLVRHRRHRPVQAARRSAPDDRRGRAAGAGRRDPAGDGAARGRGGPRSSTRPARGAPVRGARVRRARARRPCPRRAGWAGSARCPRRSRLRAFTDARRRRRCPPRRGACGPRATRTGRSQRVAVCGGAGDSALDAALAAGVDAYVTADLRHHPASEHLLRRRAAPGARRRRALGVGVAVVRAGGRRPARRRWAVASRSASRPGARIPGPSGGRSDREDTPVKADPAVQRRLLDLAEIDAELDRLAHRRRTLPEHARAHRGRDSRAHGEGRAGRGGDRGGRPRPRHPAARTRRRGRAGPRRARQEDARGLRASAPSRRPTCSTSWRPSPAGRACWRTSSSRSWSSARPSAWTSSTPAALSTEAEVPPASVAERRDTALADIDAAEAGRRRDREAVVADLPADLLAVYDRRRASGGTGAAAAAGAPLRRVPAGAGPDGARRAAGGTGGRGGVLRGVRDGAGAHAPVGPLDGREPTGPPRDGAVRAVPR